MTGKEACEEIQEALRKAGLLGERKYSVKGWNPPNYHDSTCYNLVDRRPEKDCFDFHVQVDGQASGLRFREFKEWSESSGVMEMHEPLDQDMLHPKLRKVFTALGYEVVEVANSGYQMHWDHDTHYTVSVKPTTKITDEAPPARRAFARW